MRYAAAGAATGPRRYSTMATINVHGIMARNEMNPSGPGEAEDAEQQRHPSDPHRQGTLTTGCHAVASMSTETPMVLDGEVVVVDVVQRLHHPVGSSRRPRSRARNWSRRIFASPTTKMILSVNDSVPPAIPGPSRAGVCATPTRRTMNMIAPERVIPREDLAGVVVELEYLPRRWRIVIRRLAGAQKADEGTGYEEHPLTAAAASRGDLFP